MYSPLVYPFEANSPIHRLKYGNRKQYSNTIIITATIVDVIETLYHPIIKSPICHYIK